MRVAVLYQSMRGSTARAAEAVGAEFAARGADVGVYPVTGFDSQFVVRADLVVIGTWTDGLFGIGARPGQIGKLNTLPSMAHMKTALFVTYEISPRRSLAELRAWAEERDADVVAVGGFKARKGPFKKAVADIDASDFVSEALASLQATSA